MNRTERMCGRIAWVTIAAALVATMAGCGDNEETSPMEGTYDVLRHTRNNDGCDSEGPRLDDADSHFRLALSGDTLAYYRCEAPEDCGSSINDSKSFSQRDGDLWRNIKISFKDVRLGCEVQLTERTARLTEADLRIEERRFEGEVERERGADCTDELVLDQRSALTCERYDMVLAVPAQ